MDKKCQVRKCVIIGSGEINDYDFCEYIVESADFVICADGGTSHTFAMGIMPDLIVGDLDSSDERFIDYYRQKKVEFIEFLSDKDKTDTQICLEYAMEFSCEIVILGGTGSRLDHTLANVSLLKLALDKGVKISLQDEKNKVFMIDKSIELVGQRGDIISLIPISEKVEGVCIEGAHYELIDAFMEIGNPYGVSNYFEREIVNVTIKSGYLLVILSKN